jgi:hypothetical protein
MEAGDEGSMLFTVVHENYADGFPVAIPVKPMPEFRL